MQLNLFFFFFNDTATTEIYTLSLHDALPISQLRRLVDDDAAAYARVSAAYKLPKDAPGRRRAVDEALVGAARTPLAMARGAARLAALAGGSGADGDKNAGPPPKGAALLATRVPFRAAPD